MPPQSIQDHAELVGMLVVLFILYGLFMTVLELCIQWHQGRGRHRG